MELQHESFISCQFFYNKAQDCMFYDIFMGFVTYIYDMGIAKVLTASRRSVDAYEINAALK